MINPAYINFIQSVQRENRPLVCDFLKALADAWGLDDTIYTISGPYFDTCWYLKDKGYSVVLAVNFTGNDYQDPDAWRLELGKLYYAGPPFGPYMTIVSFPLTFSAYTQAVDWINGHGPRYFCD